MRRIGVLRRLVLVALLAAPSLPLLDALPWQARLDAQASAAVESLKARYTKYEFAIPMRDGVKLFTAVYVPKESPKEPGQTYPIMLQRTPYSVAPYGVDFYRAALGPSELFSRDGFIFAYQDVRGRFMSEGTWAEMRPHVATKRGPQDIDESTDTYDTIDWLIENIPRNNGRVGLWGISYPGFYAAAGLIDAHPALKAASPQAPIADLFMGDDAYHNGAFMLAANFGFYAGFYPRTGGPSADDEDDRFSLGTPDGYDFYLRLGSLRNATRYFRDDNPYWNANVDHTTYDKFWKARSILPHLKDVTPAVLTVGGWFDAEDLAGPLGVYRAIEQTSNGRPNMLVMGPWAHGGWARDGGDRLGNLDFAVANSTFYREQIEFPFFAQILKDRPAAAPLPEAYVFETGTNQWRRHDTWPPKEAQPVTLYLRGQQALAAEPSADADAAGADEYLSDPNRPVPYLGYTVQGMTRDYMTEDQRFAATRPDVLVYETAPLDGDVTIVGPIKVDLHVATTGTDADFVVKVIDVYPNEYPATGAGAGGPGGAGGPMSAPANTVKMGGYQQLVRGEPFRGKFRNSFEKPEPFTPNQPATIAFTMPDVYHTFRKGHRIMVHVQSSWFPLVDRNPQTFVDIPKATPADFRKATHRVYRSAQRASAITVLTLGGTPALPPPVAVTPAKP